jgi:hypothetical protein
MRGDISMNTWNAITPPLCPPRNITISKFGSRRRSRGQSQRTKMWKCQFLMMKPRRSILKFKNDRKEQSEYK